MTTTPEVATQNNLPVPGASSLLNTPYSVVHPDQFRLQDYFKHVKKLDSYSVIEVRLNARETVQIVVDSHLPWMQTSLDSHFGGPVESLTLEQIETFIASLRSQKNRFELQAFLGLAPHKNIDRAKFLSVFYLDDIKNNDAHRPLVLALVKQIMIERYTKLDSRVAVIETRVEDKSRRTYAIVIREGKSFRVLIPSGQLPSVNNTHLSSAIEKRRMPDGTMMELELLHTEFRVIHPKITWSEKNKIFSIISGTGKELAFNVTGRTPAEKRFKREEDEIRQAEAEQLVPIEIGFHPFWRRLGHTTLRIGESLYELSSKGWKVHGAGADSARAYLFNNPFFKSQYAIYAPTGMPPISIGVTMMAPKHKVERLQVILENLVAAQGRKAEKFSLMLNNCNQGIMRVLTLAGFEGFTENGYLGFSSVLSFRRVLLYPPLNATSLHIYPLPGSEITETNLRRWVPRLVYRYNNELMEMTRAIPSLLWDMVVFFAKRVNNILYKYTKVRLWNDADLYHMNP